MNSSYSSCPPPWEILVLVANYLDPPTLAVASCVCKSWFISMSSDNLWQPICATQFPSLANLRTAVTATATATAVAVPFRRLYALGFSSQKQRLRKPMKPRLSLDSIIFAIDFYRGNSHVATVTQPGEALEIGKHPVFRFDVDGLCRSHGDGLAVHEAVDVLRVTWNVILKEFRGVFTMMDCNAKGSFIPGCEGWFSEELPPPACCSIDFANRLVAELRLGLRESVGGKVVIEKMSVGILSIVSLRYVGLDDALRYLQHFLLPSN